MPPVILAREIYYLYQFFVPSAIGGMAVHLNIQPISYLSQRLLQIYKMLLSYTPLLLLSSDFRLANSEDNVLCGLKQSTLPEAFIKKGSPNREDYAVIINRSYE